MQNISTGRSTIRSAAAGIAVLVLAAWLPAESAHAVGDGTFGPKTDFATGNEPRSVALADVNGDGALDVVAGNYAESSVSLLLGNGLGGVTPKTDFTMVVGGGPRSVVLRDVNGDNALDVVAANLSADFVSLLPGDGMGAFAANADFFPVGNAPREVALGDVNGDGALDAVTANWFDDSVSVLLGDGMGDFGPDTEFAVGDSPYSVVVADINSDGALDVVTANAGYAGPDNISLLLGNGQGGFAARTDFGTNDGPTSVAVADVNGDGILDAVTANAGSNDVSVLMGDGIIGFNPKTDFPTGDQPESVAVADLNGDGAIDIITANVASNNISVLLGDGMGGFGVKTDYATGMEPRWVALADLDANGALDAITANTESDTISVLLGNSQPGSGTPGCFQGSVAGGNPNAALGQGILLLAFVIATLWMRSARPNFIAMRCRVKPRWARLVATN